MLLSIVIPCFNEGKNIPELLKRFDDAIGNKDNVEIILVNNGSTDDSQAILERLLPSYPFASSIKVTTNQGYGYGILKGLRKCTGDYIGWTHADLQTEPADVLQVLPVIKQNNGTPLFIKGLRQNRRLVDVVFTWGMSVFETIYLGKKMRDINAQPNVFPKSFFLQWKKPPIDYSLDLYAYYQARVAKMKIIRIPMAFKKRIHGFSSWNDGILSKWTYVKRTVEYSKKLRKNGIS